MAKPEKLLERINALRSEIDQLLDQYAKEQKADYPGVPETVLRAEITNRAPGCQCRQAILLNGVDT